MDLTLIRFGVGHHKPTATPTGDRDLCIMEAVAHVAGEPWSDAPQCASPAIASFLRRWNDSLSDGDRDRLLPAAVWIPRLVGSRGDAATEERRAYLALDWLVRVHTPAWLDLTPSLAPHAAALRALPEVVDRSSAKVAGDVVRAAVDAAQAASTKYPPCRDRVEGADTRTAVRTAAWNAAWSAAHGAACGAAWGAAWATARSAVEYAALGVTAADPAQAAALAALAPTAEGVTPTPGATLRSTVETLQQGAIDLLDRMLACGQTVTPPTSLDAP